MYFQLHSAYESELDYDFLNHSYVCVKSHSQALIHMLNAIAVHMTYTEYLH